MKKIELKRILSVAVISLLLLSLAACGGTSESNRVSDSSVQAEQSGVETDAQENTSVQPNQVSDESQNSSTVEKKDSGKFKTVNFGDTITTDFIEMTIESASTAQKILPTDTSGIYTYKADQEDETYFYVLGNIKNIGGDSYSVEDMNIQFVFDNKYNYTGYIAADDGGDDFYGDYVKPFGTVKYYMYASIPDELIDMYSTCKVKFAFHENCEYDYDSDFDLYEYCYEINLSK